MWLKVLDDVILLKVDVVNMSFGIFVGFVYEGKDYFEFEVIVRVCKVGIVIVVVVGNEGNIIDGNIYGVKLLVENYDIVLIVNLVFDDNILVVVFMENFKKYVYVLKFKDKKFGIEVIEVINFYVVLNVLKIIIGLVVDLGVGVFLELLKYFDLSGKIVMFEILEDNKFNGFLEKV